jgi:transcriptional regulator with XRE-family HTH domain
MWLFDNKENLMKAIRFGKWLSQELKRRGLSQSDLARAGNFTNAVISNIVNGRRGVGSRTLTRIASALNLPAEHVFEKAGLLPHGGLSQAKRDLLDLIPNISDGDALALLDLVKPVSRTPYHVT